MVAKKLGYRRCVEFREEGHSTCGPRPVLAQVLKQLRKGDALIYDDLSRAFRDETEAKRIGECLEEAEARLVTCRDEIDSKEKDWCCIASIAQVVLNREREVLQKKRTDGRRMKARSGKWAGGSPKLGYQMIGGDLAIKKREAKIVVEIFRRSADGDTVSEIIQWLVDTGAETKRGGEWTHKTVTDTLKNPIYFGYLEQEVDGEVYTACREDLVIIEDLKVAKIVENPAWRMSKQLPESGT